jgi:hypothetical protein
MIAGRNHRANSVLVAVVKFRTLPVLLPGCRTTSSAPDRSIKRWAYPIRFHFDLGICSGTAPVNPPPALVGDDIDLLPGNGAVCRKRKEEQQHSPVSPTAIGSSTSPDELDSRITL